MTAVWKFLRKYKIEISFVVIAVTLVHLPLFSSAYRGEKIDATNAGVFGDFIGGYLGTIFLVVSVAFVSASFREQTSTNRRTTFETRFFELLSYHRGNLEEIEIEGKTGRRAFVSMIREFRATLMVFGAIKGSKDCRTEVETGLAYMAFYYGVGPNSTRVLARAVENKGGELMENVLKTLINVQEAIRVGRESGENAGLIYNVKNRVGYVPFDGHQSRLAHYFRHLWQLMKYVDQHAPEGTGKEYADIVRAQLSNHEQALLCLNALSQIGSAWRGKGGDKGLLIKYEMIKNIPSAFFDRENELDIKKTFPDIKFEFEDHVSSEPNRTTTATEE
ncbi:MAG: hypothetical protein RL088_722 [Verrucomicrobiota bacterium]